MPVFNISKELYLRNDVRKITKKTKKYTLEEQKIWGLSVPYEISIDKSGELMDDAGAYGLGKV